MTSDFGAAAGARRRPALLLAALALLAAPAPSFGGAAAATAQESEPLSFRQRAEASRAKGAAGAPVLVYEIADFQCPYCARFARDVFPRLDSAYVRTGKVRWVFVNLPLPSHANAWSAAEAALCAGAVGNRFWAMHDRLFADQEEWAGTADPLPLLTGYARAVGTPIEAFQDCLVRDRVAQIILEDLMAAMSSGVTGTPVFVVNNKAPAITGVKSFEEWKTVLDREIEARR